MLFSALSLKVLVGLGTVVGVSVLSIHYTSKDTNTDALNSKPGVATPESDVTPPKPTEAEIKANRSANKKEKIANAQSKISTIESEIEKLKQELKECNEKLTIENKNYNEKFNQYTSDDQFKNRPDTWSGKEDEWNNKKIDAQKLLYEVLEPQKEKTKKYCQEIEYISIKHKDDELTEAKVARNKLNF